MTQPRHLDEDQFDTEFDTIDFPEFNEETKAFILANTPASEHRLFIHGDKPEFIHVDGGISLKVALLGNGAITRDQFLAMDFSQDKQAGLADEDWEQVNHHIWTARDEGEAIVLTPGHGLVNRLFYLVTQQAWSSEIEEAIYHSFDDDEEDLEFDDEKPEDPPSSPGL